VSALVVDTSSWIAFFAGGVDDAILEPALDDGRVYLPPVVAAELLSGRMTVRARRDLENLLRSLALCKSDLGHWFRVGELRRTLASNGIAVSTPDAHVAQCALDLDADLLTADAVFHQIARHTKLRLSR
jgi:tRNA(fMet)-specific endonuclease VapC